VSGSPRAIDGSPEQHVDRLAAASSTEAARGDPRVAERSARQAVDAAMALVPGIKRSQLLAQSLRALGTAARTLGRYPDSQDAFERGLVAAIDGFGLVSLQVAELHNDLGMTWKYAGRFHDAAESYDRARRTLEAMPAADPEDIAALYHNLGGLAHARGDLAAAEPLARRAVELRSAAVGPDDPATLLDRSAHAAIIGELDRTDEAEAEIRDLLPGLEASLGPDHPEVAVALNNLGAILQRLGRIAEAEALYRRVVEIKTARLGPDAPGLAVALSNHGTALEANGRLDEAQASYERALALLDGAVAADHPSLRAIRRNLDRMHGRSCRGPARSQEAEGS
jgi:tetratricopeptide (TPR) repeat protein